MLSLFICNLVSQNIFVHVDTPNYPPASTLDPLLIERQWRATPQFLMAM